MEILLTVVIAFSLGGCVGVFLERRRHITPKLRAGQVVVFDLGTGVNGKPMLVSMMLTRVDFQRLGPLEAQFIDVETFEKRNRV